MLTKSVDTSGIIATLAGCARRRLGRETPFSKCDPAAEDGRRTSTLQLNIEGLTASKINVMEQLA